ncbi:retinol dehydrogenase 13-like [Cimex lectularius]|uniref:NADP-retinol dehydrogenase n=1 Tax=Cimex lectularius TaxID=79782 RepID=A0A8I6RS46_CIMLE|nr:retinol dehydrogenase 13-like [Cimex lectularius]
MSSIKKPVLIASIVGTIFGGGAIIKDYCGGKRFDNPVSAEGKTVIVTGANTGIGKETVRELAKRKARVIMACRNLKSCEKAREEIVLETKNKYVYCRKCDLSSQQSIREFAKRILSEEKRLDVLINNAGVMRCPQSTTEEGIELQLGVNHMGHFLLTNLLLDLLKKSAPSRIINVSSIAHMRGKINKEDFNSEQSYDGARAYAQSKLANVLFTKELSKRLEGTGVTVNSLHPGLVDTEITRHMSFFNSYLSGFILKPFIYMFIKTPRQGAQTTIWAALEPSLTTVTGQYFDNCAEARTSQDAQNEQLASWLWLVSEKWTAPRKESDTKVSVMV